MKNRIEIRNEFLDFLENTLSKMEGTYNFDIASATGITIEKVYELLDFWKKQTFIDTATEDEYIDKHALLFGVIRRLGTKARGEVTITGKANTTIPAGTIALNRNNIKFKTLIDCLINYNGIVRVPVECVSSGEVGNCAPGEITSFEISNSNIFTVINKEKVTGGYEKEPNNILIARAKEKITKPAHSGNVNDYLQWAREVDGVGKVLIKPLWNGNGTVKVLVANYNNEIADKNLVDRVKDRIESENGRPIGANVTVATFTNKNISIKVKVYLKNGVTLVDIRDRIESILKVAIKSSKAVFRKDNNDILSINRLEKEVLSVLDADLHDVFIEVNGSKDNLEVADEELLNLNGVVVNAE